MYKVKLMIGEDFTRESVSHASFKQLYKVAVMCAKQCFNNRVRYGFTVESQSGERLLRVFTYHSEVRNTWVARVSRSTNGIYNKYGLTLRRVNE